MKILSSNLLFRFSIVSFVIMATIALILAFVLSEKIRSDAMDNVVEEAVGSSVMRIVSVLAPEDLETIMTGERYDKFHRFVQESVVSGRTARIKIWAIDGTVIYSNDQGQVGQRYPNKESVQKALAGETHIEIKVPEDSDNELERHLGTLSEVYVPIVFPGTTDPAGVFEIYQYYATTEDRIVSMRNWVFGGVGSGFSFLYLGLVFIVWGGSKTIKRQQSELETFNAELEIMVNSKTAELNTAHEDLIRSEKLAALGQVSGGLAHDLRNPLGAIKNAAYWLNSRVNPDGSIDANPKLQRFLDIIDREVDRSSDYITDLMNFANVKAPTLVKTDLGEVLEEALAMVQENDKITVVKNLDSDIHPVMADGAHLQRVFLNLVNNAQEAMPNGGELSISLKNQQDHVEIDFIDSGVGISDENMGKIFDPLFTTKIKGTGLGLSVCHEIIRRHGGAIIVSQNERSSSGAAFKVKIPSYQPV